MSTFPQNWRANAECNSSMCVARLVGLSVWDAYSFLERAPSSNVTCRQLIFLMQWTLIAGVLQIDVVMKILDLPSR